MKYWREITVSLILGTTLSIAARADSLDVSLIQLIAAPEKYQGKAVRLMGFLRLQFEGNAIYLHKEDDEQSLYKNGLWLDLPAGRRTASQLDGNYVIVEATFDGKDKGHLDRWSGSLTNVTRLELYRNQ